MKIIIPGGSGQVGTLLARHFSSAGHEVVILSRKAAENQGWRVVQWDGATAGDWTGEIDGADVVINLAGRSVNCRYNPKNRREIMDSRTASTRIIGQAISRASRPPKLWLQMSTATIYAHRFDAPNGEGGIIGGDEKDAPDTWQFSIDVAKAWESAATEFSLPTTRQVLLRSAMVMSPDRSGVFDTMLGLVKVGLGGACGSGRQFISWIHEVDFINAIQWLIQRDELSGPVNIASPNPLPNAEFMRLFREAWGAKIGLPAFEWMLEIGAIALRTETELILKSRRVVPSRLLESGFEFSSPEWGAAARELCARSRTLASYGSKARAC